MARASLSWRRFDPGICHPAAAVLDVSEPSFCWESSESETCESDFCMDASPVGDSLSLRGYSPSSCRVQADECGFNLAVNLEAIPGPNPQFSEAETFAVAMLKKQWTTESNLLRLMELLPVAVRPFQIDGGDAAVNKSGTFSAGAYVLCWAHASCAAVSGGDASPCITGEKLKPRPLLQLCQHDPQHTLSAISR